MAIVNDADNCLTIWGLCPNVKKRQGGPGARAPQLDNKNPRPRQPRRRKRHTVNSARRCIARADLSSRISNSALRVKQRAGDTPTWAPIARASGDDPFLSGAVQSSASRRRSSALSSSSLSALRRSLPRAEGHRCLVAATTAWPTERDDRTTSLHSVRRGTRRRQLRFFSGRTAGCRPNGAGHATPPRRLYARPRRRRDARRSAEISAPRASRRPAARLPRNFHDAAAAPPRPAGDLSREPQVARADPRNAVILDAPAKWARPLDAAAKQRRLAPIFVTEGLPSALRLRSRLSSKVERARGRAPEAILAREGGTRLVVVAAGLGDDISKALARAARAADRFGRAVRGSATRLVIAAPTWDDALVSRAFAAERSPNLVVP